MYLESVGGAKAEQVGTEVGTTTDIVVTSKETDGIWMGVIDTRSKSCATSKCA